MSEHAIDALNGRNDRQDLRLDDHGKRIKNLETSDAVLIERVEGLASSVDKLTKAIYASATGIIVAATAVILFGGGA